MPFLYKLTMELNRYVFPYRGDTFLDDLYENSCNEEEGYGKMQYEVLQYY